MRRTVIAVVSVLLLAGCASPSPAPPVATPSPVEPSASPTAPPTATGTKTATATGTCRTADLTVTDVPDPAGGAAGHHGEFLVFENKTGKTCTLYGYPGVSWVAGDQGTQVNAPFERTGGDRKTIRLAPGGKAHATLLVANYQNVGPSACKPEKVRGYRVYPPEETAAVFVEAPQTVCSVKGAALGQVQPITAGAGG